MKKLLFLFVIGLAINTANAASPPDSTNTIFEKGTAQYIIAEGKALFNEGSYRYALAKFRNALEKDKLNAEATYWIAECHLALGNYDKAVENCEAALAIDPNVFDESAYLLGQAYHRLGELEKAKENFEKQLSLSTKLRAKELFLEFKIAEVSRAMEMIKTPVPVKIKAMPMYINSPQDEYGLVFSASRKALYFNSRRSDNIGGGVSSGDSRFFSDIYVCLKDSVSGEWGEASNHSEINQRLNTNGFDGVAQISADGGVMLLTINTMGLASPKPKTRHTDIFIAKFNNKGTWNTPKPLPKPINSVFFDAAPCFNKAQDIIYFISERPGGKGMSDIYYSVKTGKDWGKPVNIESINTPFQETTVFLSEDEKYLFFSSTGHEGMGGYDVYVSENVDGEWAAPKNLGYPINTVNDDTHFTYYPEWKKAFYSTLSTPDNGGIGMRDIFEIDLSNYSWPE